MRFYSQLGEDSILWALFKQQKSGYFLDIGALDGTRFSNTYIFELAGWRGICVEAHPVYIDLLKKNRPNSFVVHAAAGNIDKKSVRFFAHRLGTLSTVDHKMAKRLVKTFKRMFAGYKQVNVPAITINSVLEKHPLPSIDVVSIDTEGTEYEVLQGFDLKKYKPRVILVEAVFKDKTELTHDLLIKDNNYIYARRHAHNRFYCRDFQDAQTIKNATPVKPRSTKHPWPSLKEKLRKL